MPKHTVGQLRDRIQARISSSGGSFATHDIVQEIKKAERDLVRDLANILVERELGNLVRKVAGRRDRPSDEETAPQFEEFRHLPTSIPIGKNQYVGIHKATIRQAETWLDNNPPRQNSKREREQALTELLDSLRKAKVPPDTELDEAIAILNRKKK